MTGAATLIEKESIGLLSFPNSEILEDKQDQLSRQLQLIRAMQLGNNHKRKVKIFFKDSQGTKMVETTIWLVSEDNIALKTGTIIPIKRISKIELY